MIDNYKIMRVTLFHDKVKTNVSIVLTISDKQAHRKIFSTIKQKY